MTAYCEEDDVQTALQEADASMGTGPLASGNVTAAIEGVSSWFKNRSKAHFYDSGGTTTLVDTTTDSASNVTLDIPVAAHRQSGQLWQVSERGIDPKYPVTHAGPYTRLTLPYRWVESIDTLKVRDAGGGFEDWVAASDKTEGEGEDYYLRTDGASALGRSYLYIHAGGLQSLLHYDDAVQLDISYGVDYQDDEWDDVKRGIAAVAAAQLVVDDDVLTQIPDDGQLIGVDTQAQQLLNQAFGMGENAGGYLSPYLKRPVV